MDFDKTEIVANIPNPSPYGSLGRVKEWQTPGKIGFINGDGEFILYDVDKDIYTPFPEIKTIQSSDWVVSPWSFPGEEKCTEQTD